MHEDKYSDERVIIRRPSQLHLRTPPIKKSEENKVWYANEGKVLFKAE